MHALHLQTFARWTMRLCRSDEEMSTLIAQGMAIFRKDPQDKHELRAAFAGIRDAYVQ